jgi:predicted DNA-binding protein (MmcQ/YjbR family)
MDIESLRAYCLSLPGVTEDLPFGPDTLVFRIRSKIFLLTGMESPLAFNVKCDPEKAIQLREEFQCVQPGYHMNKKHWNTIKADGSVSDALLISWIDHSYQTVVGGLPKKEQMALATERGA